MHRITILSKPGCHLCDVAKATIQKVVGAHVSIVVEEINILTQPDLHAKYQNDIPVILIDGVERFKYRVDPDQLARLFYSEFGERLLGF